MKTWLLGLLALLLGLLAWAVGYLDYAVAFALGAGVGAGEIIGRYRDNPVAAVATKSAAAYIFINGIASLSALGLAVAFGWDFGMKESEQIRWIRVIVAGFGAMALFRSSLFYIRIGSHDVDVGPAGFLQVILDAADRSVDRRRARDRAAIVGEVMAGMDLEVATVGLPAICLALMQNLSRDDQSQLAVEVAKALEQKIHDRYKVLAVGLKLVNVVGEDVLRVAVAQVRTVTALTDDVASEPTDKQATAEAVEESNDAGDASNPAS